MGEFWVKKSDKRKRIQMTEKEFIALVIKKTTTYTIAKNERYYYESSKFEPRKNSKKGKAQVNLDEDYLYLSWFAGGVGGGSCWDDGTNDNHYVMTADKEPDFVVLDDILLEICPEISYIRYKKVMRVIQADTYSVNEYYGNSSTYAYKYIKLRDLYNVLKEMGII